MSDKKYKKEDCILLCKINIENYKRGASRYPQRSDFEDREVVAIKAFLGPWPRALEEAGIKPPREMIDSNVTKNSASGQKSKNTSAQKLERERKKGVGVTHQ